MKTNEQFKLAAIMVSILFVLTIGMSLIINIFKRIFNIEE